MDESSVKILAVSKEGYFETNQSQIEMMAETAAHASIVEESMQIVNMDNIKVPHWRIPVPKYNSSFTF